MTDTTAASQLSEAARESDGPHCRCGYARWHHNVGHEAHYNWLGLFLLMMGATPEPISIDFKCKKCGDSLGTSTDPKDFRRAAR